MSTDLFNLFNGTTPAAWKQKIQVDLKGADYNDTLLWRTDEGIVVKPFYTKEDRTNRANSTTEFSFNISQSIYVDDEKTANYIAKNALDKGANALEFICVQPFDYHVLFAHIDVKKTTVYLRFHFSDSEFINKVAAYIDSDCCYLQIDIINNLAQNGNWFKNLKEDHAALDAILQHTNNAIGVDVTLYQNAGASSIQQLAYALAHANEYLHYFGIEHASNFHFNFAIGGDYFFEIAKLRAFRLLWNALLKEYGKTAQEVHLFAQPSTRNKTLYDYNVNMLRTTSECMSAILGGATTVNNLAYDAIYHKKNEFGERIARNQLLILQQESYLKSANSIANGSYYIESITQQLAEKALLIFKDIEKAGGFLKQLKEGVIQRKITESAQKEAHKFKSNERILLGSNKLPNTDDRMKNELEFYPFLKTRPVKTLITPILKKRLAEGYEKERLAVEASNE